MGMRKDKNNSAEERSQKNVGRLLATLLICFIVLIYVSLWFITDFKLATTVMLWVIGIVLVGFVIIRLFILIFSFSNNTSAAKRAQVAIRKRGWDWLTLSDMKILIKEFGIHVYLLPDQDAVVAHENYVSKDLDFVRHILYQQYQKRSVLLEQLSKREKKPSKGLRELLWFMLVIGIVFFWVTFYFVYQNGLNAIFVFLNLYVFASVILILVFWFFKAWESKRRLVLKGYYWITLLEASSLYLYAGKNIRKIPNSTDVETIPDYEKYDIISMQYLLSLVEDR